MAHVYINPETTEAALLQGEAVVYEFYAKDMVSAEVIVEISDLTGLQRYLSSIRVIDRDEPVLLCRRKVRRDNE